MISLLRKNYLVILTAVLVGMTFLIPHFIYWHALGENYQGINRLLNDDELFYLARAQDVVDGYYYLSNAFYLEYKSGLPMQIFIPDLVSALPAKLINMSVSNWYVFNDFLFTTLIFLLSYAIIHLLIKKQLWSLIASFYFFVVFFYHEFNRPISPQFVFIFALIQILLLLHLISSKRSKLIIILSVLNFGFLFYVYPYFWTFFLTFQCLLIAYTFLKKYWDKFRDLCLVTVLGLFLGSFYFYQVWQSSRLEFFTESISRLGLLKTHFPSGLNILLPAGIVLCCYLVYFFKIRKLTNVDVFLNLGIITAVINVNQHVITGLNQFFSSHYKQIAYYFIFLALINLLFKLKFITKVSQTYVFKSTLVLVVILLFIGQVKEESSFDYDQELEIQNHAKVYNWLNDNTVKDEVVMTNYDLDKSIPSYTHNNVLYNSAGYLYVMSTQEVLDRFTVQYFWMEDFNREFIKRKLRNIYGLQNIAQGGHYSQRNKVYRLMGLEEFDIESIYYPEEQIEEVISYLASKDENYWLDSLIKYHVDYLIIDQTERANWHIDLSEYQQLELIDEIGQIQIYKLHR